MSECKIDGHSGGWDRHGKAYCLTCGESNNENDSAKATESLNPKYKDIIYEIRFGSKSWQEMEALLDKLVADTEKRLLLSRGAVPMSVGDISQKSEKSDTSKEHIEESDISRYVEGIDERFKKWWLKHHEYKDIKEAMTVGTNLTYLMEWMEADHEIFAAGAKAERERVLAAIPDEKSIDIASSEYVIEMEKKYPTENVEWADFENGAEWAVNLIRQRITRALGENGEKK